MHFLQCKISVTKTVQMPEDTKLSGINDFQLSTHGKATESPQLLTN